MQDNTFLRVIPTLSVEESAFLHVNKGERVAIRIGDQVACLSLLMNNKDEFRRHGIHNEAESCPEDEMRHVIFALVRLSSGHEGWIRASQLQDEDTPPRL